jgi:hypothetical protein
MTTTKTHATIIIPVLCNNPIRIVIRFINTNTTLNKIIASIIDNNIFDILFIYLLSKKSSKSLFYRYSVKLIKLSGDIPSSVLNTSMSLRYTSTPKFDTVSS